MTFWHYVLLDLKAIVSDKAISITLFGGVLFYSFLYPLPYLNEVPVGQRIVVVDQDLSSLSREFTRHADASPKIRVVGHLSTLPQAKEWIETGKAQGVLMIPNGFRRDLMLGHGVTLGYGGDANYFLVYAAIVEGLVSVGLDTQKDVQFAGMLAKGSNPRLAKLSLNSVKLNSVAVFNPKAGYMGYIVPGVLLLVLHQTLLIGTGILGAGQWRRSGYWQEASPLTLLWVRLTSFGVLYSFFASYYLGWCAYMYDLRSLAPIGQLLLFMLPFFLATAMMGIAMSCLFVRRDIPTQVMLIMSMPILFMTGIIWPLELIPEPLIFASQLIPGVSGIMAVVKLNLLGAPWQSVMDVWIQLWGLFALYLILAWFGIRWRRASMLIA